MNDRPITGRGPTFSPVAPGLLSRYHTPRRPRTGVVTVAGIIAATLFASSVPTPLYEIYQARWHFSPLILTAIYAVYALAALTALLLVGRMSDDLGRRPVLTIGLAGLIAASIAFAFADATAGCLSPGLCRDWPPVSFWAPPAPPSSTFTPRRPTSRRAHQWRGQRFRSGVGGRLLGPDRSVRPPTTVAALRRSGRHSGCAPSCYPTASRTGGRLRPAPAAPSRPHVPPATRATFAVAALAVLSSWSVAALLLSLGPQLAARLLATTSALPGGWATLAFAGSAGAAQMAFRGLPARVATVGGSLLLASGMGVTVASLQGMPAAFFAGLVATGAGFGVVFMGGLRSLAAAAPIEDRATVMSAFYIVAYLSLSVPAVLVGLIVTPLGLTRTFRLFGLVVIALALGVGLAAGRMQDSGPTSLGQHPGPRSTVPTRDSKGGSRATVRTDR